MSDKVLAELARLMANVYAGDGDTVPRAYTFNHWDDERIRSDERIVVRVEREYFAGRLRHLFAGLDVPAEKG